MYKFFQQVPFRKYLCLFFLFIATNVKSQNQNEGIYFQALARDKAFHPAIHKSIYVQTSILQQSPNGNIVFGDLHQVNTDETGVFSIMIGQGLINTGIFKSLREIQWNNGPYYIHLKLSIKPSSSDLSWDYTKEWIDLETMPFGVVPFALHSFSSSTISMDTSRWGSKLNIEDTSSMLSPYKLGMIRADAILGKMTNYLSLKDSTTLFSTPFQLNQSKIDTNSLSARINTKVSLFDTAIMLNNYVRQLSFVNALGNKMNIADTGNMLINYVRISQLNPALALKLNIADTAGMLSGVNARELLLNKSVNVSNLTDYNDYKYPSVKAIKDYVDHALIAGAPDASANNKGIVQLAGDLSGSASLPLITNGAVTTQKIQDAAVTDAKIASGINPSKIGLGNLTNHAQIYNLNGLSSQIQSFNLPGINGLNPNWVSLGSQHTLNIPMASASAVTAGLISNTDYGHFVTAYANQINSLTNIGNNGVATLTNNVLNIPAYTLVGLAGNTSPNTIFAGPANGSASAATFRALVAADIPHNNANTSGNSATASRLQTPRYINNVLFDGSSNITGVNANTANHLSFISSGMGAASGAQFNGSSALSISYNTIGAAPSNGSSGITTLGTISTGTWSASVIGANYGGAGYNNGLLKANGLGVVSTAMAGTDYQSPLSFSSPLVNTSNIISLPQASNSTNGYLSSSDWSSFNNKIDFSQKAANNGVASLDANGKIPTSQIPAISFSSGYVVTNQSSMLALSNAVVGSIAIRTDNSRNYVLSGLPASNLSNWLELLMPVSVSSVNGHTESNISLTSSDISEGTNLYYTDSRVRNALSALIPLNYNASSGVFSMTNASASSAGYLSATDWNTFNNKLGNFAAQAANTFYAGPVSGNNALPLFRNLVAADVPILNQNTSGNAATATKLSTPRNINGIAFDGSADINITSNLTNSISFDNTGTGVNSGTSFDGSTAKTISYNTIGAAPSNGSTSITTVGTISAGTWSASVIDATHGGSGNVNGILKANGTGVVSAAIAGTDFENILSFSAPLSRVSNSVSIATATTNTNGYLTATDWNIFNNKQSAILAGTGVNISGGNTIAIGQSVATTSSPSFVGATLTNLNTAGIVTNSAAGVLGTVATTGTGNVVKATSPVLVTPTLGDATATSIVSNTITVTSENVMGDITAKRYKLTMPSTIAASSTTTIDLSTGNVFTVSMGMNISTLNLTNPGLGTYLIKFVQDATGSREVSFPIAWKWAGGIAPSLTNTAGKIDIVTLIYDGSTFYATIVQNF